MLAIHRIDCAPRYVFYRVPSGDGLRELYLDWIYAGNVMNDYSNGAAIDNRRSPLLVRKPLGVRRKLTSSLLYTRGKVICTLIHVITSDMQLDGWRDQN
jgi:hypothetical protein